MSFDTIKAKQIINTLQMHGARPGGDLMALAAASLAEAVADATQGMAAIRGAEAEALKATRLYEGCLLEIKTLRDGDAQRQRAILLLIDIAATKNGASQKALDFIAAEGLQPAAPVNAEGEA